MARTRETRRNMVPPAHADQSIRLQHRCGWRPPASRESPDSSPPVSRRTMLRSATFASSVVASIPTVFPLTKPASANRTPTSATRTTSIETLIEAAQQVEAARPEGEGIEEVVGDKGYHSNQSLVDLEAVGVRSLSPSQSIGARPPTPLSAQSGGRPLASAESQQRQRAKCAESPKGKAVHRRDRSPFSDRQ